MFGDAKNPKKEKPRKIFEVPSHADRLITIATDKEAAFPQVSLMYKKKPREIKTEQDYFESLRLQIFSSMLSERFDEIRLAPNPPPLVIG